MFTGLIEEIGVIRKVIKEKDRFTLEIVAKQILVDIVIGGSIAVNGVCLTVTSFTDESFTVGLAPETLHRTSLDGAFPDMRVNLERALLPTTRMGGHYVQGHVDGTGEVVQFRKDHDALWVRIKTPSALMRYIVEKGYITIDGVSLTIVETGTDWFTVTLIAHTQAHITLPEKETGMRVNLEVDIMAKYAEKIIAAQRSTQERSSQEISSQERSTQNKSTQQETTQRILDNHIPVRQGLMDQGEIKSGQVKKQSGQGEAA